MPPLLPRLSLLAALLFLAGCAPSGPPAKRDPNAPLRAVCTTGQVADLVRNIGGPQVEVEALMGPGVDPHLFRASVADNEKLRAADVVFYNGLHLEGRLAEVLESLASRQPAFAVTAPLEKESPSRLRQPEEFAGQGEGFDPHVWFDVALWSDCAQEVARRLIEVDPKHKDLYRERADKYVAQLKALDQECREQMATIPKERRVLVTAHDAFGYFGRAYDVEVHGLQGISTADEAAIGAVNKLIDLLVERRIKAVFVESSVRPEALENVIAEAGRRGHKVVTGGELYSDAMGPDGTPEATYMGMIRYNLKTIVQALR